MQSTKRCPACYRNDAIHSDNKCIKCVNAYISGQKSGYSYDIITAAINRYGRRSTFGGGHAADVEAIEQEHNADEQILRAMGWW